MTISKKIGTSWTSSSTGSEAIKLLGACLGLGYLPKAPGTAGSLFGLLLFWAMKDFSNLAQGTCLFIFILLAIGISEKVERILRSKDPEEIVIDEAAGMWTALIFIGDLSWTAIIIGFILFRALDILKPFPINLFQSFRGGTGILADDIAAGMITNFILRILVLKSIL